VTTRPRRALAVRADSMGDVLLTGPAIRAMAARADVTLLAGPSGADAARALPGVDEVLVHALPWIVAEPEPCDAAAIERLLGDVRARDVDEAVIFTSFHQSPLPLALVLRMAGIPRIAAISSDYPGSLLDVRHGVDDDVHEVERALSLAHAAGFPSPRDDDLRLAIRRTTAPPMRIRSPYVVVHPGASVTARAWDPDRCRALVRDLTRSGVRVVVTGAEAEQRLTAFVAGNDALAHDLGGRCDFEQLGAVLASASAVVCGNTGPAHLAAAVGTPVVSLYAPTVPATRWRPWKVDHVLLGDQDIGCRGCRARECPVSGHPCLDVPVGAVIHAVDRLAPGLRWGRAA
jgi:ADP-heptose:LPS heptosyltransferase